MPLTCLLLYTLAILLNPVYICIIEILSGHSAAGIATRYGLDSSGIESRMGRDFPYPSRPAMGPTQPPIK